MSDRLDIDTWRGRLHAAHDQNWLDERKQVREKLTDWTESRFWKSLSILASEWDIKKREVNWGAAYIRALQSALYSQNPATTCVSEWHPPEVREMLGNLSMNLLTDVEFRKVMKPIISDAGLGGYGFCQVGYDPVLGWSQTREEQQRKAAMKQALALMNGDLGQVNDSQDHRIYMEVLKGAIQMWTQQYGPDVPIIGEALHLISRHKQASLKQKVSPVKYIEDRSLWALRIEPVVGGRHQVLWELEAPLDEAEWVALEWRRPLKTVMATPYYSNKDGLQPTGDINRRGDIEEDDIDKFGDEYARDVEMVRGWDIFNRAQGRKLVIAEGHQKYLLDERHPQGDILRTSGLRWLTFKPNSRPSRLGMTPLEDAASQISLINHCEGLLALILEKNVPGLVYDRAGISAETAEEIAHMGAGEQLGIDVKGDKKLRDLFEHTPGPKIADAALEALYRAEGQMALILGMGDTSLGMTDKARTATATHMGDEAQGDRTIELSKRCEEFVGDIQTDMLQLGKRYLKREDIAMLVGPEQAQWWQEPWDPRLAKRCEWLTVDAGSSLPGRKEQEMRKAMESYGVLSGDPLIQQRELKKWFFEKVGIPERVLVPEQVEQQLASMQPTDSDRVIGQPETEANVPGGSSPKAPTPGNGQPVDEMTAMRQQASTLGAETRM